MRLSFEFNEPVSMHADESLHLCTSYKKKE